MAVAVISYIPALHQGYINFLTAHPGDLFVLSSPLVRETPRMERDVRALDAATVAKMVEATGLMESARVLNDDGQLAELTKTHSIVMPDEEVNRNFAKAHLAGVRVEFIPAFLRWDMPASTTKVEVPADRRVSRSSLDRELLGLAEAEAARSVDWWRQVGAVIARDGQLLLAGHNKPFPSENYTLGLFGDPRSNFDAGQFIEVSKVMHGEAGLIAEAAKRGLALEGTSLYVTTFPCPVCAKSVAAAGIKKVYYSLGYSLLDAEDILKAHGVEIILVDKEKAPSA